MLMNGISRNVLKLNNNFPAKILIRESLYIGLKLEVVEKLDKNAILAVIKNKLISKKQSKKKYTYRFSVKSTLFANLKHVT